jgi:hypothetical protein
MMLRLPQHIVSNQGNVPPGHAEGAVRALPFEVEWRVDIVIDHVTRRALHALHQIGRGDRRRDADEKVEMVLDSSDGDDIHPQLDALSLDALVHALPHRSDKERMAIPRRPHEVQIELGERSTHPASWWGSCRDADEGVREGGLWAVVAAVSNRPAP